MNYFHDNVKSMRWSKQGPDDYSLLHEKEMTMSAEANKALMQAIFEKVSQGDGSMFMEHLAEDVVHTISGESSWSKVHRGKEAIVRDVYRYLRTLVKEAGKTKPFHYIADGDWVVIEARGDMVTQDGTTYQNHYCLLYKLKEGMIVEMKEYMDTAYCERILGPYPASLKEA